MQPFEFSFLVAANVLAFGMMGWDKWQARRGRERVPERVLLAFALPGGGVGAWAALFVFRHKSSKRSFQFPLAVVSALGLAGWWWWISQR
ncbi:MAG: DUF1294 domain-containing protein [Planctomycetota bacterium]